jgi:hypothetical protein
MNLEMIEMANLLSILAIVIGAILLALQILRGRI